MNKLYILDKTPLGYEEMRVNDTGYIDFIIVAESEQQAREVASREDMPDYEHDWVNSPWSNKELTECIEINVNNLTPGFILQCHYE